MGNSLTQHSNAVVHSGGKKVLDCVMYCLGLSKHAIRHSLSSLKVTHDQQLLLCHSLHTVAQVCIFCVCITY